MAAAIAVGWAIVAVSKAPSPAKALPHILIAITIVLILMRERMNTGISLFSPLTWALGAFFVMFSFVPLVDLWFRNPWTHHAAWWQASWIAWFAVLVLYGGYRVVFSWRGGAEPLLPTAWSSRTATLFAVAMLGVALISLLVELQGIGGTLFYFSRFAYRRRYLQTPVELLFRVSLAAPAILLVAGNWLSRSTFRRGIGLILLWLPPVLFVSTFLGQRWRAVTILVALAAIYHLGFRKIPGLILVTLASFLVAAFITVNLYRNVVGSPREVRSISGAAFYHNYLAGHELGQFRDFLATLEGMPSKLDFQHGRTFLSIIPGAPFPTGGFIYSSTFQPKLYAAGTSVSNSLLGELYMNFGLAGILGGMAAFGALIGFLETWFRRRQGRIGALLIYAYLLAPLAGILRGDFTTFAGFSLVALGPLLVAIHFVARRAPGTDQTMRPRLARTSAVSIPGA